MFSNALGKVESIYEVLPLYAVLYNCTFCAYKCLFFSFSFLEFTYLGKEGRRATARINTRVKKFAETWLLTHKKRSRNARIPGLMIHFWTSVNYSFRLPPSLFPHPQQHLIKGGLFTNGGGGGGASYRWEIVFRNWAILLLLLLLTIATAQLSFSRMEFPSIYSFFLPFKRRRDSQVCSWERKRKINLLRESRVSTFGDGGFPEK